MEKKYEKSLSLINSLIKVNTDRINGYEKAASETEYDDLQILFSRVANDSRKYRSELISEVIRIGGIPTEGNTLSGKLYQSWQDIRKVLSNSDRNVIIKLCESEEDAALDAYDDVLKNDDLPQHSWNLIDNQKKEVKKNLDHIKLLGEGIKEIQHL